VTILDRIADQKRREIASLPPAPSDPVHFREAMEERGDVRDFVGHIQSGPSSTVALIAEVKRASPSAGVIRQDVRPAELARQYEAAGAACISVLTDRPFFQGSLDDLREVRSAVHLPVLRKDFILDERQILESIQGGADAILLIAALLDHARLRQLYQLALRAGLAALIEVHDERDLDRALAAGATLIGINNRDLHTFQVDLVTTERLAAALWSRSAKQERLLVSESGIKTPADIERVRRAGARAVLVGETLVRAPNIRNAVTELLGRCE